MNKQILIIFSASFFVILLATIMPPISQSDEYHNFADQRSFLGIPNFMNVISNFAFVVSAYAGIYFLIISSRNLTIFNIFEESIPYWILFLSLILVALGSMFYHWNPNNDTLVWDRLPLVVALAALLSATMAERMTLKIGLSTLLPLTLLGVGSVLYWYWTELQDCQSALKTYQVSASKSFHLV